MLIHAAVLAIWVALFLLAFGQGGILAWSIGLAYLGYDVTLLVFTGWHIRRLTPTSDAPVEPSVGTERGCVGRGAQRGGRVAGDDRCVA